MNTKRLGVFSGTFDPIHFGHVEACRSAMAKCALDKVYMLLERSPHRKQLVAPHQDRLKMMDLATKDSPSITPIGLKTDNISTQNTLEFLKEKDPESEYWYIFGSDILEYIESWKGLEKLLNNFHLCVVLRDNADRQDVENKLEKLTSNYGARYVVLPTVWSTVSSSVAKNALPDAEDYLDPLVQKYVIENNLYSSASSK